MGALHTKSLAGLLQQVLDDGEVREVHQRRMDVFVAVAWPEIFPYLDPKAAQSAVRLGVRADPGSLAGLVKTRDEFARLVAALVRVQLTHRHDEILKEAGGRGAVRTGWQT